LNLGSYLSKPRLKASYALIPVIQSRNASARRQLFGLDRISRNEEQVRKKYFQNFKRKPQGNWTFWAFRSKHAVGYKETKQVPGAALFKACDASCLAPGQIAALQSLFKQRERLGPEGAPLGIEF
jgi:hypothetical protein